MSEDELSSVSESVREAFILSNRNSDKNPNSDPNPENVSGFERPDQKVRVRVRVKDRVRVQSLTLTRTLTLTLTLIKRA
jgi:hypothetical protein